MEQIEANSVRQEASNILDMVFDNPTARCRFIDVPSGYAAHKVTGGWLLIPDSSAKKSIIPLEAGERLHPVHKSGKLQGFILQPPGAPTLRTYHVAELLHCKAPWVEQLARRGPLHDYPGFQAYKSDDNRYRPGWLPKIYDLERKNRASVRLSPYMMFYESDILAWLADNPSDEMEEERKRELEAIYKSLPEQLKIFLRNLAEENRQRHDSKYIIRQEVRDEAVRRTRDLSEDELLELTGRTSRLVNRDYTIVQAMAHCEQWANNPRNPHSARMSRRKRRVIQ